MYALNIIPAFGVKTAELMRLEIQVTLGTPSSLNIFQPVIAGLNAASMPSRHPKMPGFDADKPNSSCA